MGLAAALEYMKDAEGWGGGVSRYFEKCAELNLPPPKVEELDGGFFRVTFYRDAHFNRIGPVGNEDNCDGNGKSMGISEGMCEGKCEGMSEGKCESKGVGKEAKSRHDKIIELLSADSFLTREEIAAQMGLSLSRIEKVIRQLRNEGRLIREGSSRNGYWKVVK